MINDVLTIKDRVLMILEQHPETRNDDKKLIFKYLLETGQIKRGKYGYFFNYNQIPDLTSFESIRRVRQLIQNKYGLYLPTDLVREHRELERAEMNKINTLI